MKYSLFYLIISYIRRMSRVAENITIALAIDKYRKMTFAADDGLSPDLMKIARGYVENRAEMLRENIGLLLYGDVGTGKSYGAACIANRLIEQSIPACMINLSTVLNSMGGFQSEEKNTYISDLMRYPLLILDDFGMERQTEYALEQVFNVIDARYRSGLPFIITTNLDKDELTKTTEIGNIRIYDRVLEKCHPVKATGESRRRQKLKDDFGQIEMILKGEKQ